MEIFCSLRWSARSFSMCLNSSWVVGEAADQPTELSVARAFGEVERIGGEWIGSRAPALDLGVRGRHLGLLAHGDLADAVRDVIQDIEARHTLRGEQVGRMRLRLL